MLSVNHPEIRFLRLPKVARYKPQDDFPVEGPTKSEGNWRRCVPEQVDNCTAVGYYFARRLRRALDTPVGLIDVSWGGTMAQHWVTQRTLRPIPAMKPHFDKFEKARKEWIGGGREEGAAPKVSRGCGLRPPHSNEWKVPTSASRGRHAGVVLRILQNP